MLYSEIDLNPLFKGHANEADRSMMNAATFNLCDDNFKDSFESMLLEARISALYRTQKCRWIQSIYV